MAVTVTSTVRVAVTLTSTVTVTVKVKVTVTVMVTAAVMVAVAAAVMVAVTAYPCAYGRRGAIPAPSRRLPAWATPTPRWSRARVSPFAPRCLGSSSSVLGLVRTSLTVVLLFL